MFRNFLLTFIILALSVAILYTTIFNLDPLGEQKAIAFSAFFLSVFGVIASFFTFTFFFAAEIFAGRKLGARSFAVAVRRGIFMGLLVCALAGLQLLRLLSNYEIGLLVSFFVVSELIILSTFKN